MSKPFKLTKISMDTFNAGGFGQAHHDYTLKEPVSLEHETLRPSELFRIIVSKMIDENLFPFTANDMFVHFQTNKHEKTEISLLMGLEAYANRRTKITETQSNADDGTTLREGVQQVSDGDDVSSTGGVESDVDGLRSGLCGDSGECSKEGIG